MEAHHSDPPVVTYLQQPPNRNFRRVFLFLLLVTLATAAVASYILATGKKPQITEPGTNTSTTNKDNPFVPQAPAPNPFTENAENSVTAPESANPFEDTNAENPFDQFETTSQSPNPNSFQNPF